MAVPPLEALCAEGHEVLLVVTGADTRRGRGSAVSPSPVKAAARELGLAVSEEPLDVLGLQADLAVVVAYGRIISTQLLDHLSMVNLHFSLLPRWRGAAPVERAILAGDSTTGVCIMKVEEGLDTGGIYAQATLDLDDQITAQELRVKLVQVGSELLVTALADGLGEAVAQSEEGVTYAHKLHSSDAELHWEKLTNELLRTIRVGGAWTIFRQKRLKVLHARKSNRSQGGTGRTEITPGLLTEAVTVRTGDSWIDLLLVQPEGKSAMGAQEWANGARPAGEVLGR